ncbi:putative hydrolase of the HAD superfamily [Tenacibaculum adriaticum]|uniref:Putative hydrolase of the HAD superfamily n=1 Tax=Tenacibaculum adriaticum TaxID=413713 RepID=A0A5S5DSN2_9FLAO|nr:YjjG family noncanonical pyrimidine nucleotidase [Tenacibaculum adriaticum]TYP98016.1 putative hydrolase of the HAD superfamily [Tenacibaculum adriaticum]
MDNIKHIFFDLDHTLWDFDKNSKLSFQQIFKEQNIDFDFELFIETYIPINHKYWELYREEKVSKADLRYGRLKDTFNTLKFNIDDELINLIAVDYIEYLPKYNHLIDGSIDLLEYLKKKYQLHIITNGFKEVQFQKLEKSNIKQYFNIIVTSDCVGVKKPNPRVFEYALEKVNSPAQDCVMIGDSYEADVLGAFNTGILPIHFDIYKKTSTNSFAKVNSLMEIKQYL